MLTSRSEARRLFRRVGEKGVIWVAEPSRGRTRWPRGGHGNPVDRFDLDWPSQATRLCMEASDRLAARLVALKEREGTSASSFIPLLIIVDGPVAEEVRDRLDRLDRDGRKAGMTILVVAEAHSPSPSDE